MCCVGLYCVVFDVGVLRCVFTLCCVTLVVYLGVLRWLCTFVFYVGWCTLVLFNRVCFISCAYFGVLRCCVTLFSLFFFTPGVMLVDYVVFFVR